MQSVVCEPDFIPPYLARSNKTILEASISARKISEHRTRFTYTITWEEDVNPRIYSGKEIVVEDVEDIEMIEYPIEPSPSNVMTLDQRSDGHWTVPRTTEMIWTRAITFNKSAAGKLLKKEYWGECESSRPVGEMVNQLLEDIPYPNCLAKVYLCPVTKGDSLVQLTDDNIHKSINQLDLHHGKLCLVIDYVNLF